MDSNVPRKDMTALSQLGGNIDILQQPGPKREQVQKLCEVLKDGL